jgi:hypothetical protein
VLDVGGISIKDEVSNGSNSSQSSGFPWNEVPKNTTSEVPKNTTSERQGKVGSLSFNVIDTSSPKQLSEFSRPVASGGTGDSVNKIPERTVARKPAPRAKVPFEKGYSQMDWLKLTQTHPDLAGT